MNYEIFIAARKSKLIILIIGIFILISCSGSSNSYTLYRNSVTDENMRIHVATFDTKESQDYNMGNCMLAVELFQKQEGLKTKFWCEKGTYRK